MPGFKEVAERARRRALAGCIVDALEQVNAFRRVVLERVAERVKEALRRGLCHAAGSLAYRLGGFEEPRAERGSLIVEAEGWRVKVYSRGELVLECIDYRAEAEDAVDPYKALELVRVYRPGSWERALLEWYAEVFADKLAAGLPAEYKWLREVAERYGLDVCDAAREAGVDCRGLEDRLRALGGKA